MPIEFSFLADRVDAIPVISEWYFDQWGDLEPGRSIEHMRAKIEGYLNREEIPFMIVASQNENLVAVAQLKFREMEELFPDKEHWLGGVYVAAGYRGQGYAAQIVERIVEMAPSYGVETLYLQTEAPDGGLYARLGWAPLTRVTNRGVDVLVMERHLTA